LCKIVCFDLHKQVYDDDDYYYYVVGTHQDPFGNLVPASSTLTLASVPEPMAEPVWNAMEYVVGPEPGAPAWPTNHNLSIGIFSAIRGFRLLGF
jgi:hypothetical protein